jgi:flavin reductase (DIM6/NTAB) family NADH-FMN oxidoreductase RutF
LTADNNGETEIYFSASFAQLTLEPPRVIVNPSRTYAIENVIRAGRLFAINILSPDQAALGLKVLRLPRRQRRKAQTLDLPIDKGLSGIPHIRGANTLFCEVEFEIASGDRQLYVARVIGKINSETNKGKRPLLFAEVSRANSPFPRLARYARTAAIKTGLLDLAKTTMWRLNHHDLLTSQKPRTNKPEPPNTKLRSSSPMG